MKGNIDLTVNRLFRKDPTSGIMDRILEEIERIPWKHRPINNIDVFLGFKKQGLMFTGFKEDLKRKKFFLRQSALDTCERCGKILSSVQIVFWRFHKNRSCLCKECDEALGFKHIDNVLKDKYNLDGKTTVWSKIIRNKLLNDDPMKETNDLIMKWNTMGDKREVTFNTMKILKIEHILKGI